MGVDLMSLPGGDDGPPGGHPSGARAVALLVVLLVGLVGLVEVAPAPDLVGLTVQDAESRLHEFDDSWVLTAQNEAPADVDVEPVVVSQSAPQREPGDLIELQERSSHIVLPVTIGVVMPDIVGLREQKAREDLRALGLATVEVDDLTDVDSLGPGEPSSVTVRGQRPAAGELLSFDDTVSLTLISAPSERVGVPTLVGQDLATARRVVAEAGLRLSASQDSANDIVQTQDPVPGLTVERGSVVSVEVGVPPDLVEVPNLLGLTPSEARNLLGRDLILGPVPSNEAIIGQAPAAAEDAPRGSTISVTVGEPTDDEVVVPTVLGRSLQDARLALKRSGLTAESSGAEGTVVEQDPQAGAVVPRDTAVTVVLTERNVEPLTREDDSSWGQWGGVALAAGAAAVFAGARTGRRRGRSWAGRSVTAQALPSRPHVSFRTPESAAVMIRLVPHPGGPRTYSTRKFT